MKAHPRGGLFQDDVWIFREIIGCSLERFVGYLDEPGGDPLVFFLKPSAGFWQRFYLDAGLGFWGEYGDEEVAEELEDEEESVVDYGERLGIVGESLGMVRCEPGPRIRVAVAVGEIILETVDRTVPDAPTKVPFFRLRPAG